MKSLENYTSQGKVLGRDVRAFGTLTNF